MLIDYWNFVSLYSKAKKWKFSKCSEIREWVKNEENNLKILYDELISDTYKIWKPIRYISKKWDILREIIYLPFRDRIVQYIVHQALYPIIENLSYNDIYWGFIWKWTLYWVRRISKFMRSCSDNFTKDAWILKLDIKSFFLSINKDILWDKLLNLVELKKSKYPEYDRSAIISLMRQIIFKDYRDFRDISDFELKNKYPIHKSIISKKDNYWLPHWNLTSQLFVNLYLHDLDVFIKNELWIKYYGRYVDDFIIIHNDKNYLLDCIKRIREFLNNRLKLTLHPNKIYLQHISKWVNFLWVMLYPYYSILWKKTIYNWNRKIKNLKNLDNPVQILMSYDWIAKHFSNYKLRQQRFQEYKQIFWYDYRWFFDSWINKDTWTYYDKKWYDQEWFNKKWIHRKTKSKYNPLWWDKDWINKYTKSYFDKYWYDQNGLKRN